jgi:hypothetical protein
MLQISGFNVLDGYETKETCVHMEVLKFHCLISIYPFITLCSGSVTPHLIMYLSVILLSFITALVLLTPEMSSFSCLIAQFVLKYWSACQC